MKSSFNAVRNGVVRAVTVGGLLLSGTAFAQGALPEPRKEWDVTLGAGALLRPTYEGSDRYTVSPVPVVSVIWRDAIALDAGGLNAYWRQGGLKIGGGLTFDPGRQQKTSAFSLGDDRLYGLGDIPAALGVRGFASYRLGPVELNAALTKLTASGNDGLFVTAGVSAPVPITDRTTLIARAGTTWADQNYMQTRFGVTPGQSFNSGYAAYTANSGFKDVSVGLGIRHRLDEHWSLMVNAGAAFLTGDAANSPLTRSTINGTLMSAVAYRF